MAAEARRVGSAAGLDDAAGRRDGEAAEGDARAAAALLDLGGWAECPTSVQGVGFILGRISQLCCDRTREYLRWLGGSVGGGGTSLSFVLITSRLPCALSRLHKDSTSPNKYTNS